MTEKPLVQTQVASVGADDPGRNERLSGRKSKKPGDSRLESQRDVDRITYSREWRRLGAVTQVVTPSIEENPLLHTRLTHSEKVAQVARSIAAHLFEVEDHSLIARLGGIDLHVCEAAALAHDLGHPPFGHVGELTLDRIARKDLKLMDGFEGNAQSIRIVTIGSLRSLSYEGLDLTKATLAAIAKYPWIRARTLADEQQEKSAFTEMIESIIPK